MKNELIPYEKKPFNWIKLIAVVTIIVVMAWRGCKSPAPTTNNYTRNYTYNDNSTTNNTTNNTTNIEIKNRYYTNKQLVEKREIESKGFLKVRKDMMLNYIIENNRKMEC